MGEEVLTALSPSQQVVKIVRDETGQDPGQPPVAAALRQRAADRHHDRRAAGLGQDHLAPASWRAGCRRTGTRPHDGFGGRLPSGGARSS